MTNVKLDMLPHRSAVLADHRTEMYVLVRAQAPSRPYGTDGDRTPLNLALVLDRSGSMSGAPLEEAKRSALYVIEQLDSRDRASLIVYDNRVDVLLPATPVVDKVAFRQSVNNIHPGGSTALFDGWKEGARQALSADQPEYLSRVLLLSDGNANFGLTSVSEVSRQVSTMLERGVSTSTYGLGHRFNEELMVEIAKAGGGQSYYGEAAEDLLDPFQEEFSLMSALAARHMKLTLSASAGVQFELLNDYRSLGPETWRLPDLAFEGEAWALVRLRVPALMPNNGIGENLVALEATLEYTNVENNASQTRSFNLQLPRVGHDAWTAIAKDERVTGRVEEVRVAQLQREVRDAALRSDWSTVDRLLAQAEQEAGTNIWVKASLKSLRRHARNRDRDRTSKEAYYSARKMSHRLAEHDEDSRHYHHEEEASKAAFLRKKMEQGKQFDTSV